MGSMWFIYVPPLYNSLHFFTKPYRGCHGWNWVTLESAGLSTCEQIRYRNRQVRMARRVSRVTEGSASELQPAGGTNSLKPKSYES